LSLLSLVATLVRVGRGGPWTREETWPWGDEEIERRTLEEMGFLTTGNVDLGLMGFWSRK
jgi:hypothetical protein